jgi:hypothetical protein
LEAESFAQQNPGKELPEQYWCSEEERWHKPDKYAVRKMGQDKAVRVVDTEEIAKSIIRQEVTRTNGKYFIEFRPGEDTKCTS